MTKPYKKKLIEVAIPLEAINAASIKEKGSPFLKGHSRSLHQWWARRPLAACRAVLFAQLVDDPSSLPDQFPTTELQDTERKRLFAIIEDLVKWENSTNEAVLNRAREEIRKSSGGLMPPVYDPFSGGGAIPQEAQRLGLPAYGSDLNPVAVMIGKSVIEIPVNFKAAAPVHPGPKDRTHYQNSDGLAEDIRFYGRKLSDLAKVRIGHLYPSIDLPKENGGGKAAVIAWIWARTVPSPDPAFSDVDVPLATSFLLSSKVGREAWIEPVIDKLQKSISYRICTEGTKANIAAAGHGTAAGKRQAFRCIMSDAAITYDYIRKMGKSGRMGQTLIAIVAEAKVGRVYVAPSASHEITARSEKPEWRPETLLPDNPRDFKTQNYGLKTFADLFTDRQLVALNTFGDVLKDLRNEIESDAKSVGLNDGLLPLREGGVGAKAYAEAVSVYLSFALDKVADYGNSICGWNITNQNIRQLFARQAIPMSWDFVEVNPFGKMASAEGFCKSVAGGLSGIVSTMAGKTFQADARSSQLPQENCVISTDPPYYDNIGYADLSDFFYVWLRRNIKDVYPELSSTINVPKSEELVAASYRHGGSDKAEEFFLHGMTAALSNIARQSSDDFPATIYYAFKQSEIDQEGLSSTGWAAFLEAVIEAEYGIVGTWPVRTERTSRIIASGANALATSVVLVCRKRQLGAETVTRAEFIRALKRELPVAIKELQAANIAPADMPQSAIGPGMGVFSRYRAVLEFDDNPMSVKAALQLINRELDEYLGGIQGEFDADTRFAITWFEQNGLKAGDYGTANSIATARGISVESVKHAGIVESQAGKVRVLRRDELDDQWEPGTDQHLTIWECLQYLVRRHEKDGISQATAILLKKIGDKAEAVKDLAYILYDISANKRQDAKEATAYNALIADWTEMSRQAAAISDTRGDIQQHFDL